MTDVNQTRTPNRKRSRSEMEEGSNNDRRRGDFVLSGTKEGQRNAITSTAAPIRVTEDNDADALASAFSMLLFYKLNPIDCLSDEIFVGHIFPFVGVGQYRYIGGTNLRFQRLYKKTMQQCKESGRRSIPWWHCRTTVESVVESVSHAILCYNEMYHTNLLVNSIDQRSLNDKTFVCCSYPTKDCIGHLAAFHGNLEVLAWAFTKGYVLCSYTTAYAAAGGHLEVLQWARKKQCEWNWRTCAYAAGGGHLHVLQWARQNGCDWNYETCTYAAQGNHLKVLQWARKNGCDWNSQSCATAAGRGHLKILQWLHQNGCDWTCDTCACAAKHGCLEVLQWARENGCSWDSQSCANAAENGHLEVLQWLHQNGCNWDYYTCTCAARGGQLKVLQWLRKNGCDWNSDTCAYAAQGGHL